MSTGDQSNPPKNSFKPSSHAGGVLHRFTPQLTAFEHAPASTSASPISSPTHTVIFINGLYGRPLSVPYPQQILPHLPPNWRLAEPLLSSAGKSFGFSSLAKDVSELGHLVAYLREIRPKSKIVLLGHSTGCQDALHYLTSAGREKRAKVDGVVLQGPVSDREGLEATIGQVLGRVNDVAKAWVSEGRGDEVLPRKETEAAYPGAPMTAKRWLSLTSPGPEYRGEDDYFSSDLGIERWRETFAKGGEGVGWLVLHMGSDQFVPEKVDKATLVSEWKEAVVEGGGIWDEESGVLEGGDHALETCGDDIRAEFGRKVGQFLSKVEGKGSERL